MSVLRRKRGSGFSVIEVIIASAIALVAAGVIIQVMILTVRTTDQTSSQADAQSRARAALLDWEKELRDAYAILSDYTIQKGPDVGAVYTTEATDTQRTIVAAVPSIDGNGAPCVWRGNTLVFDCVIWQAVKSGEGEDALWELSRLTHTGAFRMADSYFKLSRLSPPAAPFTSLICGQTTSTSSSSGDTYVVPAMGREEELEPVSLFSSASDVGIEFRDAAGETLAPDGAVTEPPTVSPSVALPFWVTAAGGLTSTPISVTGVAAVHISLKYKRKAATMQSGQGEVTESDTQSVTIRLRNKQNW